MNHGAEHHEGKFTCKIHPKQKYFSYTLHREEERERDLVKNVTDGNSILEMLYD